MVTFSNEDETGYVESDTGVCHRVGAKETDNADEKSHGAVGGIVD